MEKRIYQPAGPRHEGIQQREDEAGQNQITNKVQMLNAVGN